jgi:hypothetical protein
MEDGGSKVRQFTMPFADDPCRLVRQVKEIRGLERRHSVIRVDPCRLARQVNQMHGIKRHRRPSRSGKRGGMLYNPAYSLTRNK